MDWILSQARYYKNLPQLNHRYRSVVHIEDEEDKPFWDELLQRFRPGTYFYVPYSKSDSGNVTSGCTQCLKFKPYLDSRFFICIDSDFRHLMGEPDLDAAHYVIQTYTYSWENHKCEANTLQTVVSNNANGCGFDFSVFLQNLSTALYEPLLLLLYCKRVGDNYLNEYKFRQVLKKQCSIAKSKNNGEGYVNDINNQFAPFLSGAAAIGFNLSQEIAFYSAKGLNANNAYLHVRGHNIYDLVLYIGDLYCKRLPIDFESDVVAQISVRGTYWEYEEIGNDLKAV